LVEGADSDERGDRTRSSDESNLSLPGHTPQLRVPARRPQVPSQPFDARSELDRRIATAPISDLPALLQARGAIIEQDERRLEGVHIRRGQMGVFYSKIGFSIAAALGGTTLIVAGFGLPGFFLLGGAAAVYVPEYVKNAIDQFKPGDDDA
jgi:hypothetical protein